MPKTPQAPSPQLRFGRGARALVTLLISAAAAPAWAVSVELVSKAAAPSRGSGGAGPSTTAVSADGRYAVFVGTGRLVPGQSGPESSNLFLHDLVTGTSTLISHASDDPTRPRPGRRRLWGAPVLALSPSPTLLRNGRLYVGTGFGTFSIEAANPTPPLPNILLLGDPLVPKVLGPLTLDVPNGLLLMGSDQGLIFTVTLPF